LTTAVSAVPRSPLHGEGDDHRQVGNAGEGRGDAQPREHHLHADKLQRHVRHDGGDAGERDGQRQCLRAEAALHIIGGGDIAVPVRHGPQAREAEEKDGIDQDGVGHGEEADRAGGEHGGGHRDEGIGGVEVAAQQEPGDDGAEAAPP
jgi:hypothetical protein